MKEETMIEDQEIKDKDKEEITSQDHELIKCLKMNAIIDIMMFVILFGINLLKYFKPYLMFQKTGKSYFKCHKT